MDTNIKGRAYYIGDIAKELGLSQRAVRYYEELGFIRPTRTEGGFRKYSECDLSILRIVLNFKDLGMSLDDIRQLLLPDDGAITSDIVRHLSEALSSKREDFELKLKKYKEGISQINRVLEILADCSTCGKPSNIGVCEDCLHEHGGDASPLIHSLLASAHER